MHSSIFEIRVGNLQKEKSMVETLDENNFVDCFEYCLNNWCDYVKNLEEKHQQQWINFFADWLGGKYNNNTKCIEVKFKALKGLLEKQYLSWQADVQILTFDDFVNNGFMFGEVFYGNFLKPAWHVVNVTNCDSLYEASVDNITYFLRSIIRQLSKENTADDTIIELYIDSVLDYHN